MHTDRVVAIAADYADALLVFRRAKRALILLLVLMLLAQMAIFATAHFAPALLKPTATTQPNAANWPHILHYATAVTLWLSMIFAALLVVTLFATIHVMLVGRLIGVSLVARAFTISAFLLLLLMPWQALLVTAGMGEADPVLPGVLYTWREISDRVPLPSTAATPDLVLYWARFAVFPFVALVMLLLVQVRSGRGLKLALGEEELLPPSADDLGTIPVR
jgi:hypothetical protein